jgi:hypothetical protein
MEKRVFDPSVAAATPEGAVPTLLAADLQDHLMTASNDLDRLQRLLTDASTTLLQHFHGLSEQIARLRQQFERGLTDAAALEQARSALSGAVVALQFQDMASQLIAHTDQRLRSCADRLARDALADDEDGEGLTLPAPLRPNPVTQDELDAGSIELF